MENMQPLLDFAAIRVRRYSVPALFGNALFGSAAILAPRRIAALHGKLPIAAVRWPDRR